MTKPLTGIIITFTMKDKEFSKDREFAVILEEIHSDFKVFAEDLSSVKKRLDMLFEEFGKQKEGIFEIKTDIRIIKSDIAEIKETLKTHDKRLTHLETLR